MSVETFQDMATTPRLAAIATAILIPRAFFIACDCLGVRSMNLTPITAAPMAPLKHCTQSRQLIAGYSGSLAPTLPPQ